MATRKRGEYPVVRTVDGVNIRSLGEGPELSPIKTYHGWIIYKNHCEGPRYEATDESDRRRVVHADTLSDIYERIDSAIRNPKSLKPLRPRRKSKVLKAVDFALGFGFGH